MPGSTNYYRASLVTPAVTSTNS